MDLKEILEYKLLDFAKYELTTSNVLAVVFIILVTQLVLFFIKKLILSKKAIVNTKMDSGRRRSVFQILKYFIWVVSIGLCLEAIGIQMNVLLAGSAALLVGIGLGLQQIFNDFVSGILLLFEGTIEVGDVVEVDGIVGRVVNIKLRTSEIISRDDINIIIPNHKMVSENVINWSHSGEKTRFYVQVGVAYGTDTDKVITISREVLINHPMVCQEPKPFIRFNDFGDSALIFQLIFWSEDIFRIEIIKSDIRIELDKAFRQNGISIPFPQRDLHLRTGFQTDKENPK